MKCGIQIGDKVIGLSGLDNDIIYICLNSSPDEVPKNSEHTSLVRGSYVFEAEQHSYIAIRAKRSDERSCELVRLFHFYLVIARICIKKG
jgi:hypothetical protein